MAGSTKGWRVSTVIVMLHAILILGFVGEDWLVQSVQKERAANGAFFSEPVADHAQARAERWFKAALVDTGISAVVWGAMIPSAHEADQSGLKDGLGELFSWWEGRLRTWWTILYQVFVRVSYAGLWFPYALFVLAPFVIDGWVKRRIKQTDFSLASPLKHRLSMYLIEFVLIGYLALLFLPIPLQPIFLPLLILGSCAAAGKVIAEFQKRA